MGASYIYDISRLRVNEWSYTPLPPICFYDMHKGNCNFTFHIEFE